MDNEDRDHFRTIASPLAPLLDALQKPQSAGSSRSDLDPTYCLSRTRLLFSCYRKDEAHDPETYCSAVAATLSEFPRQVVDFVTDPRTGIPSSSKWLPNVAEVREACVTQAKRLELGSQPRVRFTRYDLPEKPPGDLFVGIDRPRYAQMSERLDKEPDQGRRERGGIWIPSAWYEQRAVPMDQEALIRASREHFKRECREEGIDPAGGISPSLLKTIGEKNVHES